MVSLNGATDEEWELVFQQQSDGRRVARLPTGKVVLIDLEKREQVQDGETWRVRVRHLETHCSATPLKRTKEAPTPMLPIEVPPAPVAASKPILLEPQLPSLMPEDLIGPSDRVAIFVDAANTDGSCRNAGYWIGYDRVLKFCRGKGVLFGGYYYAGDFTPEKDNQQQRFLDFLNHAGYAMRLKPIKRIIDHETGDERFKANVDTEIVVDMLNTSSTWDVAWLLSGDSDFAHLLDVLRSRGKRVYVLSSRRSLSRELAYAATPPVYHLEDLAIHLKRLEAPAPGI